jgi:precorrin-6Y C5,15-methyltransferase (decarboxylating) CbiT subunit
MKMSKCPMIAGISDNEFIRGEVPMTKEEVRVLSLSKLHLTEGDRIADIGAGTGSVSVEIARLLPQSPVFAVEHLEKAVELIRLNATKFATPNIRIIVGKAPEVLRQIPDVNKIFIGGSDGSLKEILEWVNTHTLSGARVVVNAVTLDTLFVARDHLSTSAFHQTEIIQVSVNRIEKAGNSDMFRPQSPVFIISATRT